MLTESCRARSIMFSILAIITLLTTSCLRDDPSSKGRATGGQDVRAQGQIADAVPLQEGSSVSSPAANAKSALLDGSGRTIEDRFLTPEGFVRTTVAPGSFGEFLRTLPLKPDGAEVHYYDGRVKSNRVYEAVLDIDVGSRDLQQCADAVMRLRAEYLYKDRRYDDIHFNFANGFRIDYRKWMDGYRVVVNGNKAYWVKAAAPSSTYLEFRKYLDVVFAYANTASLAKEMKPVDVAKMSIGDVFVDSGHSVIVVDMAENKATGKKLFMIAQSYMPAQDIHVLENPINGELSPWYELNFGETLRTPEWTFTNRDLRSFK